MNVNFSISFYRIDLAHVTARMFLSKHNNKQSMPMHIITKGLCGIFVYAIDVSVNSVQIRCPITTDNIQTNKSIIIDVKRLYGTVYILLVRETVFIANKT